MSIKILAIMAICFVLSIAYDMFVVYPTDAPNHLKWRMKIGFYIGIIISILSVLYLWK